MGIPQHRQCHVLVVDDHADTRDLLERLLSRKFEVTTAGCYESALASASLQTPDIVVTDIALPGGDGVTLMRELRRRHGISGIAVTGHPIENATAFRDAGFVNWLRKPIQLEALLEAVTAATLEPRAAAAVVAGAGVSDRSMT